MVCADVVLHPEPAAITLFEKLVAAGDRGISCGVVAIALAEFFEKTLGFLLDGQFKSLGDRQVIAEIYPSGRMVDRWRCIGSWKGG